MMERLLILVLRGLNAGDSIRSLSGVRTLCFGRSGGWRGVVLLDLFAFVIFFARAAPAQLSNFSGESGKNRGAGDVAVGRV